MTEKCKKYSTKIIKQNVKELNQDYENVVLSTILRAKKQFIVPNSTQVVAVQGQNFVVQDISDETLCPLIHDDNNILCSLDQETYEEYFEIVLQPSLH